MLAAACLTRRQTLQALAAAAVAIAVPENAVSAAETAVGAAEDVQVTWLLCFSQLFPAGCQGQLALCGTVQDFELSNSSF